MFIDENCSRPPKNNYSSNKTAVYHFDDIWSLDLFDLGDYGPENNRGCGYVLVVMHNVSNFGWTVPLTIKNVQTIKNSFGNVLKNSKRKAKTFENDQR